MSKYMRYRAADYAAPYSKFYNETIAPVPDAVTQALKKTPYRAGQLPPVENAPDLLNSGYAPLENGYTLEPDGSLRVAVLTPMPRVSPVMWDWWFGWHGSRANRYKLWHPKAHRDAVWKDGADTPVAYVGRVSLIEEYIGTRLEKAAIRFVSPAELGFDPQRTADKNAVVLICARVGYTHWPLDFGWLVHQVRATENGAEMRSRFWMGGPLVQLRWKGPLARFVSKILQKTARLPERQAKDLFLHCSEEMNHLAAFLPDLYTEFQHQNQ